MFYLCCLSSNSRAKTIIGVPSKILPIKTTFRLKRDPADKAKHTNTTNNTTHNTQTQTHNDENAVFILPCWFIFAIHKSILCIAIVVL